MKKVKKLLRFLLVILIFVIGVVIGYARRADIADLIDKHEFIGKITDPIEKIGEKDSSDSKESPSGSRSTGNTSSLSSSSSTNSSKNTSSGSSIKSSGFTGEVIKGTANGKTYSIRKDFKEAMDAYEAFYDEYFAVMKKINSGSPDALMNYYDMLEQAEEMDNKMDAIKDDLTESEDAYLLYVTMKIEQKMVQFSTGI